MPRHPGAGLGGPMNDDLMNRIDEKIVQLAHDYYRALAAELTWEKKNGFMDSGLAHKTARAYLEFELACWAKHLWALDVEQYLRPQQDSEAVRLPDGTLIPWPPRSPENP